MLGSDSLALPLLDFQYPILLGKEELQSGLVRNEVRNGNGNAPAGIHAKCHPAGAYIFRIVTLPVSGSSYIFSIVDLIGAGNHITVALRGFQTDL